MQTDNLDRLLQENTQIEQPGTLNAALLQGFDDFHRKHRARSKSPFLWFFPTAGSLASLSFGLMAGFLSTTPAYTDRDESGYILEQSWDRELWELEEAEIDE